MRRLTDEEIEERWNLWVEAQRKLDEVALFFAEERSWKFGPMALWLSWRDIRDRAEAEMDEALIEARDRHHLPLGRIGAAMRVTVSGVNNAIRRARERQAMEPDGDDDE